MDAAESEEGGSTTGTKADKQQEAGRVEQIPAQDARREETHDQKQSFKSRVSTRAAAKASAQPSKAHDNDADSEEGEDGSIVQRLKRMMLAEQGLRSRKGSKSREQGSPPVKSPRAGRWLANLRKGRLQGKTPLLDSFDLEGVAAYVRAGKAQKIIVMCGAGISVNAGIPDFRSPGTGLYDNLAKYDLPHPEAVFELSYFRKNPRPFFSLAKELFPGTFKPTATHSFLSLLEQKGLLRRCYTQNIDSLERQAGVHPDLIVPAHGNFDGAHCIDCRSATPIEDIKASVLSGEPCHCSTCDGLVKPDIVFFGEGLPERFFRLSKGDFKECDLLIVLGTSLVVQPFASLIGHVAENTPRILINKEKVTGGGVLSGLLTGLGTGGSLDFSDSNYRDALYLGDCDQGIWELCKLLGWDGQLQALQEKVSTVDWEKEVNANSKPCL